MEFTENIVLLAKRTRWKNDLARYGSESATLEIYRQQNKNTSIKIIESHKRQLANLKKIKVFLPKIKIISLNEFSELDLAKIDLFISFGGDNHFIAVAKLVGDIPLIGINSDTQSSTGALLYYDTDSFLLELTSHLKNNKINIQKASIKLEEWTRIEGQLLVTNHKSAISLGTCVSEISVRSSFHDYISNFLIYKNNDTAEEMKCSGLLLVSGAGSSGWYRNAHYESSEAVFAKDAPFFKSIARETQYHQRKDLRYINPQIYKKETLTIISKMDGEITIDSNIEEVHPFPAGSRATFFISSKKLKVLRSFE